MVSVAGLLVLAYLGGIVAARHELSPTQVSPGRGRGGPGLARQLARRYPQIRSKFTTATTLPAELTVATRRRSAQATPSSSDIATGPSIRSCWTGRRGCPRMAGSFNAALPQSQHLTAGAAGLRMLGRRRLPSRRRQRRPQFRGPEDRQARRCSQILWRVPTQSHHALDVLRRGADGQPSSAGSAARSTCLASGPAPRAGFGRTRSSALMSADGSCRRTPPYRYLLEGGLAGALDANGLDRPMLGHTDDPLHLNDIEVLRPEMAAAFPQFAVATSWSRCAI